MPIIDFNLAFTAIVKATNSDPNSTAEATVGSRLVANLSDRASGAPELNLLFAARITDVGPVGACIISTVDFTFDNGGQSAVMAPTAGDQLFSGEFIGEMGTPTFLLFENEGSAGYITVTEDDTNGVICVVPSGGFALIATPEIKTGAWGVLTNSLAFQNSSGVTGDLKITLLSYII